MPDEQQTGQDAQATQSTSATSGTQSAADQQQGRIEDLPTWAQSLVKELRDEAASRRLALKKQEEESAKATQARLAEEGKWKELAEARAAEAAKLQPYQERAATLEKMISDSNARRIAQIPEALRSLVPDGSAEQVAAYLDKNWTLLQRKPAPDLNAGEGSGGSGQQPLTEEEKQMAARFGLTPEKFAAQKAKK